MEGCRFLQHSFGKGADSCEGMNQWRPRSAASSLKLECKYRAAFWSQAALLEKSLKQVFCSLQEKGQLVVNGGEVEWRS